MVSPAEVITQPKDHGTDVKPLTFFLLRLSPENPYCLWLSSNIKKLKNPMNLLPQRVRGPFIYPPFKARFQVQRRIRLCKKQKRRGPFGAAPCF